MENGVDANLLDVPLIQRMCNLVKRFLQQQNGTVVRTLEAGSVQSLYRVGYEIDNWRNCACMGGRSKRFLISFHGSPD
jgi:hypothetical protein